MEEKAPRKTIISLDEGGSSTVYVWQNNSGVLYELDLYAVGGDIIHSFKQLEKFGEEDGKDAKG